MDSDRDSVGKSNNFLETFYDDSSSKALPSGKQVIGNDDAGKRCTETKVLYGNEGLMQVTTEILQKCKNSYSICCDKNGPSVTIEIPAIMGLYTKLKEKGVRLRFITEITEANAKYCSQIIKELSAEVKHLEGIKGNFAISDGEIYAATSLLEEGKPIPELIYSNVKGVVEQNQYLFETLWKKATPAEQKIREIEKGLPPVETRIIDNPKEIFDHVTGILEKNKMGLSNCSSFGGFQLIYDNDHFFRAYINLLESNRDGKSSGGIRWVTHIEDKREQVSLIKKFLRIGVLIRHVNNLPPLHFALSESQFQATIEKMEGGTMFGTILYSTEPLYIRHFQSIFEELWKTGIDAEQRIWQIERGIASEKTEVIGNPLRTRKLFLQTIKEAKEEIMIVFPSFNAIKRQKIIGVIDLLREKSNEHARVRILSPINEGVRKILGNEKESLTSGNIVIREIVKQQDIKSTILMVDKKRLLAVELADDSADMFDDAIGLAIYSTSKPTIMSNMSIFESLWTQTELYDHVRIANEKLEAQSRVQNDFINMAAHELKTPTQAILGYIELARMDYDPNDIKKTKEYLDAISRNATRLSRLAENILDVARIENKTLMLNNKLFDLWELVSNVVEDFNSKLSMLQHKDMHIIFEKMNAKSDSLEQRYLKPETTANANTDANTDATKMVQDGYLVYADKGKIEQVVVNLLSNAVKFSNEKIVVKCIRDSSKVIVQVRDFGPGIDPEIMPSIFSKFVSKSAIGTGLGLYISKNIIEAHGGQVWAQNNNNNDNEDGLKGATFSFSLPTNKKP